MAEKYSDNEGFKGSISGKSGINRIDDDYIRKFFRIIYDPGDIIVFRLFGDSLVNQRLWAERVSGKSVIKPGIGFINLKKPLAELREYNKLGYNIYCGINSRLEIKKPGEQGGAKNVKDCRWLFIDCDLDKEPYKNIPKKQLLDFIKFKISKASLPTPTLIISTGHGYHVYWKLNKPLTPEKWEPIQDNLIYTFPGDPGANGTDRLMRVPGFKNTKGKPFVKCRFEEYNKDAIYTAEQIAEKLREIEVIESKEGEKKSEERKEEFEKRYDFQYLNILEILVEEGKISAEDAQKFSANQQNDIKLHCAFLEFHAGEDKTPSLILGINGKYKGIARCFGCVLQGKKSPIIYTILQLVLRLRSDDPWDRDAQNALAIEWDIKYPGFLKYDIFKLNYPVDNLDIILKRYFMIPKGKKRAGQYHLWVFRDILFYYPDKRHIVLPEIKLRDLIWERLSKGKYWKKVKKEEFKLEDFPADNYRVKQIMDAVWGTRNVEAKKKGYAPNEKVRDVFYIDKTRPNLPPIEDLLVVENGILNIRTREINTKGDPNLFCAVSLPVKYDLSLQMPEVCIKTLTENLGTEKQLNQHYKRDALICLANTEIQALFVKVGLTGSGKGLDIRFTKLWIGEDNYIEAELGSVGEKWGLQNWPGKLVAFISDIDIDEVGVQKMAQASLRLKKISGNDEVNVRLPGGTWINNVKLSTTPILACTEIPKFANSTDEMVRRLVVEDHKSQWVEEDKENFPDRSGDPDLDREEEMVKEKDAYFTHCVINQGMKMLLKDEGFESTEETKKEKKEALQAHAVYGNLWTKTTEDAEGENIIFSTYFCIFKVWCYQTGHQEELFSKKTKKEIIPGILSRRLRKVVKMDTDEVGQYHTKVILNKRLTKYGEYLWKLYTNGNYEVPDGSPPEF